jgi:hypothetical protein
MDWAVSFLEKSTTLLVKNAFFFSPSLFMPLA